MKKSTTLFIAAIILGSFVLLPFFTFAQVGISLYPIKFRLTIEPGKSYSDTVTVINPNNFPIGVKPEVENIAGGEEGSIDLFEEDIPYGLMAWISVDRTVFTLGPQERRQVPFSINIPENGEPGGHYGAILFRAIPPPTPEGQQSAIGVSGRVGTVILVEVPGATIKTGELTEFTGPKYIARGPVEFVFKVKNTGNTHYNPEGKIIIDGIFAKKTEIGFEPRVVFPGYSRTFKSQWPIHYAFGPLTATAQINVPGSGTQLATLTFFAFPWQESGAGLLLVLILWFGLRTFRKKFKIVKMHNEP